MKTVRFFAAVFFLTLMSFASLPALAWPTAEDLDAAAASVNKYAEDFDSQDIALAVKALKAGFKQLEPELNNENSGWVYGILSGETFAQAINEEARGEDVSSSPDELGEQLFQLLIRNQEEVPPAQINESAGIAICCAFSIRAALSSGKVNCQEILEGLLISNLFDD